MQTGEKTRKRQCCRTELTLQQYLLCNDVETIHISRNLISAVNLYSGRLLLEALKSGDEQLVSAIVAIRKKVPLTLVSDERDTWQNLLAEGMTQIPTDTLQQEVLDFPADWFRHKSMALYTLLSTNIDHLRTAPLQAHLIGRPDVQGKSAALYRVLVAGMARLRTSDLQLHVLNLPAAEFTDKGDALYRLIAFALDGLSGPLQQQVMEYPPDKFHDAQGRFGFVRYIRAHRLRTQKDTRLPSPT
jgi:hypothetical protein